MDELRALRNRAIASVREHEASLSLLLWALVVLGFFTLSNRQEYYSLPALPALALMIGAVLTQAECTSSGIVSPDKNRSILNWHLYGLVPVTTIVAIVCGYFAFTAPHPAPGTDIVSLLTMAGSTEAYNLSLSHVSDLTTRAMGLFRGPLAATTLGMLGIGPISYLLRRRGRTYAANLTLAAAMIVTLLAAHEGLVRFYPIIGSKGLALAINQAEQAAPNPGDLIVIDGELTCRLLPDLLHRPTSPPHQRPRQRLMVRQLLARRPTHLRNRRLPPPALGQPAPHLPLHLQPHHPH